MRKSVSVVKFEVAERMYRIVVDEYNIPPTDLMFDPLVFPLSTGQEQTRKSAIATFDAIKLIKTCCRGHSRTSASATARSG